MRIGTGVSFRPLRFPAVVRRSSFALLVLVIAQLTGCAPTPSYITPAGPGAYLQNRLVEKGNTRFFYFFEFAGIHELEPTGINKALTKTRAIFKTNSPYDAKYKIVPGRTVVGVRVVYTPYFGTNVFSRMNDVYYHIFVRDLGFNDQQIAYYEENLAGVEADDLSGTQGLEIDARAGKTYLANCRIENGRAYVWIENLDGEVVSRTVTGFGEPNPALHGAWNEMARASTAFPVPANTLPDPRKGWGILNYLPEPPN